MLSVKRLIVHLRRRLPPRDRVLNYALVRPFAKYLDHPKHWHANRNAISKAVFIGFICAWIPLPGQMAFATVWAAVGKANIPVSIAVTWLSNPFTYGPMFVTSYLLGNFLVGLVVPSWDSTGFTLTHIWSMDNLRSFLPLLLGCCVLAIPSAMFGWYFTQRLWIQAIRLKKRKRDRARPVLDTQ